jgi:hypothetical protein
MLNHEFKNPHECARCMTFLFAAVQITYIMSGKRVVIFIGKIHSRDKTHWENGNFIVNMWLLNFLWTVSVPITFRSTFNMETKCISETLIGWAASYE